MVYYSGKGSALSPCIVTGAGSDPRRRSVSFRLNAQPILYDSFSRMGPHYAATGPGIVPSGATTRP